MANEAVILQLLGNGGDVVRYTCASGTAITKGTILKLTDPCTAAACSAANDKFAGICAADKSGSDWTTTVSAYTNGIFDLYCDGTAITAGEHVSISGANIIKKYATLDFEKGQEIGTALETAALGTAETIAVRVSL